MRGHRAAQPRGHPDRGRAIDGGDESDVGAVQHPDMNRFPQAFAEAAHDRCGGRPDGEAAANLEKPTGLSPAGRARPRHPGLPPNAMVPPLPPGPPPRRIPPVAAFAPIPALAPIAPGTAPATAAVGAGEPDHAAGSSGAAGGSTGARDAARATRTAQG